jgi:hypothetical protein
MANLRVLLRQGDVDRAVAEYGDGSVRSEAEGMAHDGLAGEALRVAEKIHDPTLAAIAAEEIAHGPYCDDDRKKAHRILDETHFR